MRDAAGNVAGAARDGVSGGISGAGALAGGAAAAVGAAAMSARGAAGNAGDAVGDAAERAYAGGSERVREAGNAVRDTAETAYDGARDAGHATARSLEEPKRSGFGWLKWLLPLVLLAALAWYFLGNMTNMTKPEMPSASLEQSMTVGDVNVAESFRGTMDGLKTSVGSITDVESAQAALPGLTDAAGKIEGLSGMAENLTGPAKGAFGGMVSTALAALRPMIETAIGLPGVGPIIEPVVAPMLEQLDAMAG